MILVGKYVSKSTLHLLPGWLDAFDTPYIQRVGRMGTWAFGGLDIQSNSTACLRVCPRCRSLHYPSSLYHGNQHTGQLHL